MLEHQIWSSISPLDFRVLARLALDFELVSESSFLDALRFRRVAGCHTGRMDMFKNVIDEGYLLTLRSGLFCTTRRYCRSLVITFESGMPAQSDTRILLTAIL